MISFNDISMCTRKDHASFQSCNCLDVDVATTGYCGGDSGHGGRTYLKLMDADCSDIDFLRWAADTLETMANNNTL